MAEKPRMKVYKDGAVEPPASLMVSPQDGTPVLVHDGCVYDDSENDWPVSETRGSRVSNRIRQFFGIR